MDGRRNPTMMRSWLVHPLTEGLDLDDPATTLLRRRIVREKRFLNKVYREWYREIVGSLPAGKGPVLELGSGAGFLKQRLPGSITSDFQLLPGLDLVANAEELPFGDGRLRAIVMTNLLHHLSDPGRLFAEAARCVHSGGIVSMIEPWVSPWSRFVYGRLHHEPFDPEAAEWSSERGGPLSHANGALPWIVFHRDRIKFEGEFPSWNIERVRPMMPLSYLLSGGVSMRGLMPGWTFGLWKLMDGLLAPSMAMFAHIVLRRA
jgi:SAM-dependent methyltransferase